MEKWLIIQEETRRANHHEVIDCRGNEGMGVREIGKY